MIRKWHHGHSLAAGALVGMAATQRPLVVFAAGVLVGALVVLAVKVGRAFGGALLERLRPPTVVPSTYDDDEPELGVRDRRAELIGRLHTDVSLLAATLPGKRRRR
jgi:hypothetical protein